MKTKKKFNRALLFGLLVAGFSIPPGLAEAEYRPYYGWGSGMMGYGLMGWFGSIGMILFWILIILVILLLIKGLWPSKKGDDTAAKSSEESALEILKKRYARGEINKEEFLEKKKDLES